jgi:hypothetical protein
MITGVKQASNTSKLTTDISDKSTEETEATNEEHREIKRSKLLETTEA